MVSWFGLQTIQSEARSPQPNATSSVGALNPGVGWIDAPALAAHEGQLAIGIRFRTPVDGAVAAQPVPLADGDVIVATAHDMVYRLRHDDGSIVWRSRLGLAEPAGPREPLACNDVAPSLGVLATPALGPGGEIYLTARVWDGHNPQSGIWQLHALDPEDGHERGGFPVTIEGRAGNDGTAQIDPVHLLQRPAPLVLQNHVWIAFGSICDVPPYRGWIATVDISDRSLRLWTDEPGDRNGRGGIWESGARLTSDDGRSLLLATGDGDTDPLAGRFGSSVLRLGLSSSGSIVVRDFYAPPNANSLSEADEDIGSAPPVPLAADMLVPGHGPLLFQASKGGTDVVLDERSVSASPLAVLHGDAVLSSPVSWAGDGGLLFVAGTRGVQTPEQRATPGTLRAYRFSSTGSAGTISLVGSLPTELGSGSGSPVLVTNGLIDRDAVVWLVDAAGQVSASGGSTLLCVQAAPGRGTLNVLRSFPLGRTAHFTTPAIAGDRLWVGTADGLVVALGPPAIVGGLSLRLGLVVALALAAILLVALVAGGWKLGRR